MYHHRDEYDHENENAILLVDRSHRVTALHVRGTWGDEVPISKVIRRWSGLLNFIPHGCVAVAFRETRTRSCCVDDILYALAQTVVTDANVRACYKVVPYPSLISCPKGFIIFLVYIIYFKAVASHTRREVRHS